MIRLLAFTLALVATAGAQLTRQPNTTLNLPDELPAATGYVTQNALGTLTFSSPIAVTSVPGETNRLFVVERGSYDSNTDVHTPGTIQVVTNLNSTLVKTAYFNLSSVLGAGETARAEGEDGFLSLAFHPQFATNGTFFIYYSMQVVEEGTVRRFQRLHKVVVSAPAGNTAVIVSHAPLLTMRDDSDNHNGGALHFGSDGYLYLSLGDEGGGGDQFDNARFINKGFWGQLLRIDVDNAPTNLVPNEHTQVSTTFPSAVHAGTYKIPADNPFIGFTSWHNIAIGAESVRTEIWATGLRNPFRWSFDPPTGRLFLADVGQETYEEINIVQRGDDMGWSWREGLHAFSNPPAPTLPPATGFDPVSPIYEYDHTDDGAGSGNDSVITGYSVIGGMVYRGGALSELYGKYIFADYGTGIVVALTEGPGGVWTGERLASERGLVDFGVNPATGEMLMCDMDDGIVSRLVRSETTGTAPPATLSAAGVFSDLATLTPNAGVVPYAPNVVFWSDYAIKSRWFAIKNLTDTVGFSANGNWTLPAGMVWVKHFDFETTRGNPATRRKLETRILVKTANDVYGLSYKWRADQTDADLVAEDGLSELIASSNPAQTWRYPSRTECRICHTQVGGFALSFNTRQMNREQQFGAQTLNQLTALSNAGYFSTTVSSVNQFPAFAAAGDAAVSREWRVRSYLAVNCIQCHQPGGVSTGYWDARSTTPTDLANLIGGALVNNGGNTQNRWCVAGDTTHSMILKRLAGTGIQRMPPLATTQRDLAAEQLITDWITLDLPARQSFAQWQTVHFPGGGANAQPDADPDSDALRNTIEFLAGTSPLLNNSPFLVEPLTGEGTFEIHFTHPANRSVLVETSTDLSNWSLWNVPQNVPLFPAVTTERSISGPMDAPARYFRLKFSEF